MGYSARQNETARKAASGELYSRRTIIGAMDHALEIHAAALRLFEAKIVGLKERIEKLEGPQMTLPDIELVSAAAHDGWMASKRALGVESRKSETGEELMVPYAELSESAKDLDRGAVRAVYAAIASCQP